MKRNVLETVGFFGIIMILAVPLVANGCAAHVATPPTAVGAPVAKTTSFHGRFHIEYAFTKVHGTSFADTCNPEIRAEETIEGIFSEVPPDTVRIMWVHPDSIICGAKPKKTDGVVEGTVVVVYERSLTAKETAYVSERMGWLKPAPVVPVAPKSKPAPKGKAKTKAFATLSR
jgi:hypothetical protein